MLARVLAAIPCLLIAWSTAVYADVLALRDGRRINGILSNGELVRDNPGAYREISFLVGTGPQAVLRRFATYEIEWILIEQAGSSSVIDFDHLDMEPSRVPVTTSQPPKRNIDVYVDLKGGVTWARFRGEGSEVLQDYRNGKTFGIGLTMLKGGYFGMSIGASYVEKGAVGNESTGGGQEPEVEFRLDYVEIPALIIGRLGQDKSALRVFAGPTFSFRLAAETVAEGWTAVGWPGLDGQTDIANQISDIDIGGRAGVGLEFTLSETTKLLIEGNYTRTFSPFDESIFIDWTHEVFSVEVGLSISLHRGDGTRDSEGSTRPRWGGR